MSFLFYYYYSPLFLSLQSFFLPLTRLVLPVSHGLSKSHQPCSTRNKFFPLSRFELVSIVRMSVSIFLSSYARILHKNFFHVLFMSRAHACVNRDFTVTLVFFFFFFHRHKCVLLARNHFLIKDNSPPVPRADSKLLPASCSFVPRKKRAGRSRGKDLGSRVYYE